MTRQHKAMEVVGEADTSQRETTRDSAAPAIALRAV